MNLAMKNIKRLTHDDPDRIALVLLFREAKKHAMDGSWRQANLEILQAGRKFKITAEIMLRDTFFSYKNLEVKALDRKTIIIQ